MSHDPTHAHDHAHDHAHGQPHACGHVHPPDLDHGVYPPLDATDALVLAVPLPGAPSDTCAHAPLRPPFVHAPGRRAAERVVDALAPLGFRRLVAVIAGPDDPLREALAPRLDLVFAPPPLHPLTAGLSVLLSTTRPPDACLIWDATRPLASGLTLSALLRSGYPALAKPHIPWLRAPHPDHFPERLGQPWLVSHTLADTLRHHPDLDPLSPTPDLLLQRVAASDPYMDLPLDTRARALAFAPRPARDANP